MILWLGLFVHTVVYVYCFVLNHLHVRAQRFSVPRYQVLLSLLLSQSPNVLQVGAFVCRSRHVVKNGLEALELLSLFGDFLVQGAHAHYAGQSERPVLQQLSRALVETHWTL